MPRLAPRTAYAQVRWIASFITTVDHDFGKRLTQARLARGVTVEEAANATRMRAGLIRALEEGNLTEFPNSAYAKSFLLLYARFLQIDISSAAEAIDTSVQMRVEDFQYLTSRASEERRLKKEATDTRYDFVVAKTTSGSWMPLIVILIVAALSLAGFIVWNNLHRLDDTPVAATVPERQSATPKPVVPEFKAPSHRDTAPRQDDVALAKAGDTPTPSIPEAAPVLEPGGNPPAAEPLAGSDPTATVAVPNPPAPAPVEPAPPTPPAPEEETREVLEPGTIILEPHRKTWIVIRTGPGGQMLYEDFLYPNAKAMHLPAGRYFIELKDAAGVEITKDGKEIAYTSPGIVVD